MIELIDTLPDINVQPAEYKRLLGYPREHVLRERPRELADWARAWYAKNGKPWVYAREVNNVRLGDGSIDIDGVSFTSKRLHKTLADADAHGVVLVAVGAGPEVENEAHRLWKEEKPDEYFFLEIYGSAVVEHLVTTIAASRVDQSHARSRPAGKSGGDGIRNAPPEEIAAGGVRSDAAPRSRPSADGLSALRKLLVRLVPIPSRAVHPRGGVFQIGNLAERRQRRRGRGSRADAVARDLRNVRHECQGAAAMGR
jgi:hypothetical protein